MTKGWRGPTVLVVGLGNLLLTDECLGVHVVRALGDRTLPAGIALLDGGTARPSVADAISHADGTLVVDAALVGAEPGAVRVLDKTVLRKLAPGKPFGPHGAGLADVLKFLDLLRWKGRLRVLAVEPAEVRPGLELSAVLREALPRICERVEAEAARLLKEC